MKSRFFLSFILLVLLPVLSNGQSRHMMLRDADTAYKNNMYQEAESNYRKARELDKDVQATFNLGNASYNQGKFEEAAKYFDEAGNLSTDAQIRSNAFFNKGNSMHQAGDLAGALDSYKEALKLNPNDAEARDNYLSTLKKLETFPIHFPSQVPVTTFERYIETALPLISKPNPRYRGIDQ